MRLDQNQDSVLGRFGRMAVAREAGVHATKWRTPWSTPGSRRRYAVSNDPPRLITSNAMIDHGCGKARPTHAGAADSSDGGRDGRLSPCAARVPVKPAAPHAGFAPEVEHGCALEPDQVRPEQQV